MLADIARLSVSERIQLVEDIWDTIATDSEHPPVTQAQQDELDRRIEACHQNPQGGSSWQEIKAKIKSQP